MENNEQISYNVKHHGSVDVRVVELDGHKFIISSIFGPNSDNIRTGFGGGISMIHSPGCPCLQKE